MHCTPAEKRTVWGFVLLPLTLIWFPVVCGLIYNSTNLSNTTLSAVLLTSAVIASVITAVALYFYIRRRQNCAKPVSTDKEAQQESLIRTWLARDILSGTGAEESFVEQYFPKDQYADFCVAVITPQLTPAQTRAAADKLSMPGTLCVFSYGGDTLAVYAAGEPINPSVFSAGLEKQLRRVLRQPLSCHGGKSVSSILALSDSYTDALTYLTSAPGVHPLLSAFRDQLKSGDQPQLVRTLQQLEELLSQLEPAKQRRLCLQTLSIYLQATAAQTAQPIYGGEAACSSNQQLFRMIRHAITNLSTLNPDADHNVPSEMQDILLDYVDQNCLDSALCLNSAADYLNTSIYVVSRIFKEATGVGFKEYITAKRLQYACHLLKTTRKTVGAVAAEAGFENSTYFTTVFKSEYGMPPSKYRAAAQHDSSAVLSGEV